MEDDWRLILTVCFCVFFPLHLLLHSDLWDSPKILFLFTARLFCPARTQIRTHPARLNWTLITAPFFFSSWKSCYYRNTKMQVWTHTHRETLKYTQTPDSPAEAEATRLSWQPSCKGAIGQGNDVLRNVCCKGVCKFATRRGNVLHTHTHIHTPAAPVRQNRLLKINISLIMTKHTNIYWWVRPKSS